MDFEIPYIPHGYRERGNEVEEVEETKKSKVKKKKLKKALSIFLDDLENRLSVASCNDLEQDIIDIFSKKEWIKMAEDSGFFDPDDCKEDFLQTDFIFLEYLRKKLEI